MMPELIANVTFSAEHVAALVIAIVSAGGLGAFGMKKVAETRQIKPDPLRVAQHEFVPRREFDAFRSDVRDGFTRLESELSRQGERVETKHLELLATIERAAKVSVDGRVALWNEVNMQGKQIAALDKSVDIAGLMKRIDEHLAKGGAKS